MVSTINELVPETGIDQPVQVIRDNFARAKLEIEELQDGKVSVTGDIMTGVLRLLSATTATLPSPAANTAGILYNTDTSSVAFSNGSNWIDVISDGDLVSTNNLSDVANGQTAINNLTSGNTVTASVLQVEDNSGDLQVWSLEEDSVSPTNDLIIGYASVELIRIDQTGDSTFTGSISFDGNLIAVGDDTNIDINITPKGTGQVVLDGLNWPSADGTNGQVLTTDGAGNLTFQTSAGGGLNDVVDDTTPQLGGDLDVNGSSIVSTASNDIVLDPSGLGRVEFGGVFYSQRLDDVLTASATNEVLFSYDASTYGATFVDYALRRDVGSKIGTLKILNDSSTASLFDNGQDISSPGVTFSAAINGSNVEVRYTSTAGSSGSISYSTRQWFVDDYPPF